MILFSDLSSSCNIQNAPYQVANSFMTVNTKTVTFYQRWFNCVLQVRPNYCWLLSY